MHQWKGCLLGAFNISMCIIAYLFIQIFVLLIAQKFSTYVLSKNVIEN